MCSQDKWPNHLDLCILCGSGTTQSLLMHLHSLVTFLRSTPTSWKFTSSCQRQTHPQRKNRDCLETRGASTMCKKMVTDGGSRASAGVCMLCFWLPSYSKGMVTPESKLVKYHRKISSFQRNPSPQWIHLQQQVHLWWTSGLDSANLWGNGENYRSLLAALHHQLLFNLQCRCVDGKQ